MNVFFLDASALSKRYSPEIGAALIDDLFNRVALSRLSCLMLGVAEVVSVLVRRRNGGRISQAEFTQGMTNLTVEFVHNQASPPLTMDNRLISAALPYIATYSINSTDAVVLQLCLELAGDLRRAASDLVLVCSDRRLVRAAQAEGLTTFNPETQTQADLDALIGP